MKKYWWLTWIICLLPAVAPAQKPNIILIMADDMGAECLSINGATSYQTPTLDKLARSGIRFSNVFSQPLCTPSRVKIMTGKHNYRNYEYFGYLNPSQKTFGNLMKEAGYRTCISGKWQLNGLTYKLPGYRQTTQPQHFGFDEHCLWQLNHPRKEGERYANPLITENGKVLDHLQDGYGPDIFSDFVCNFIDRHATEPFFIYYPMVLVHDPFVPTPDSPTWKKPDHRMEKDTAYFKDMVAYADKVVAKILQTLKKHHLEEQTLVIFTGDNGTNTQIITQTNSGPYRGGKSFTTQRGIHVPFLVSWPGHITGKQKYEGVIDFSDVYPTLAAIAGADISNEQIDGTSFLPVLQGDLSIDKKFTLIHYDPNWGRASTHRNRFAMTKHYKLYRDGKLYNFLDDIDELHPLSLNVLIPPVRIQLQHLLDHAEKESPWKIK